MVDLPPPADKIGNNVHEIKTQTELVRYYHAAAGFPTRPSWLATIRNGHYETWPGLSAAAAAKYFPELHETWKGHDRKVKSGLRSTKKLIEEKGQPQKDPTLTSEQAIYVKDFDLRN